MPPTGDAGLTTAATLAHNGDGKGAHSSAQTPSEQKTMARKPENPSTPNIYRLIEDDPTVPKSDFELGPPPEPTGEPKPMADLSKPDNFPDDVRAVIDSAP